VGVGGDGTPVGTGLKIVAALARQLRAEMEVLGPPGMRYRFTMELEDQEAELSASLNLPRDRHER
jgi:hypothetical protein